MVSMIKKINEYINLSIILSVLFMIVGILLIVWPKASLDTFAYVIGTIMIIYGIYSFIDSFSINPALCLFQMTNSILSFLLGICVFLNPSIFESILPIALGIFFIIVVHLVLEYHLLLKILIIVIFYLYLPLS